jgi:protease-4
MSVGTFIGDLIGNGIRLVRNAWRLWGLRAPDYVLIEVSGSLPERRPPRRPLWQRLIFGAPSLSIEELNDTFEIIAHTPRVRGVILRIGPIDAQLARVQSVRDVIGRFRQRGKRVVAYLQQGGLSDYLAACAAHEIIAPRSAQLWLKGLEMGAYFINDALEKYGVQVQVEAIAEYKTALDAYRRSRMSEAHREMLNGVLESQFEDIVTGIATARQVSEDRVRELLARGLLTATEAQHANLVDGLLYEDELAAHLRGEKARVSVVSMPAARTRLRLAYRWRYKRAVGIVSLDGNIGPGESQRLPLPIPSNPFIPPVYAGSDTITRALRAAERNPRIGALLLHVASRGGDALASDLIWREVVRVGRKKPVVAYMGDVAASGGYYVLAGAAHVAAQASTITGSIGILGGKPSAGRLLDRIGIHHERVTRGNTLLWDTTDPWDEAACSRIRAFQ